MRCIAFVYRLKVIFHQLGLSGDESRGITLVENRTMLSVLSPLLWFSSFSFSKTLSTKTVNNTEWNGSRNFQNAPF